MNFIITAYFFNLEAFLKQIKRYVNWGPNFDFHFFPLDSLVTIFCKLKAI